MASIAVARYRERLEATGVIVATDP